MGRVIGIDLGTTNSVAAYWAKRRPKPVFNRRFQSPLTPSVIAFDKDQRFVGQDAKDRRLSGSKNVAYSVKRFIGRDYDDPKTQEALDPKKISFETRRSRSGEVEIKLEDRYFSPVELSAMILAQMKSDAENELGEEVTHAVITVPAYFGQRQKNATREAGKLAGLSVLRIINEPTASALSFGIDEKLSDPQHILVYDFGGGTFDISILLVAGGNFEVLTVDGNNFLGGDDFDNLIQDAMFDQICRETGEDFRNDEVMKNLLKGLAEQMKIDLSVEEMSHVARPGIAITKNKVPVDLDYQLSREQFETMIAPLIDESIELTKHALKKQELSPQEVDRVLLVGGSTRIPLVRRKLKEMFGDRIEIDVDPMLCVALGAAIQSTIPIEWLCKHCHTINEGTDEICRSCGNPHEENEGVVPTIPCDSCKKANRQGQMICWNCGARIGALIDFDDLDADQDLGFIRIGDITPKHLAVEVMNSKEKHRSLKVIIPKGTPYPTPDPFIHDLYTNRTDQTFIELPVYEIEEEDSPETNWEPIGTVYNEKIPSGTPVNTPVSVEMRIDGDGILEVISFLKRMKDETLSEKKFEFTGIGARPTMDEDLLFWVEFYSGTYLSAICEIEMLNKYLQPFQVDQAKALTKEGMKILDEKDLENAQPYLDKVKEFILTVPPPVWELFWTSWIINNPNVTVNERRQLELTVANMEKSADLGDFDTANKHLNNLRSQLDVLWDKLPSNLLRAVRG